MIEATLPIETVSEANSSEHWTKSSKRHKMQQLLLRVWAKKHRLPSLPVEVTLTRLSPRELDTDNLAMAFKWIRDELSEILIPVNHKTALSRSGKRYKLKGRQDSDERIKWLYGQEKAQIKGVRIRIETVAQQDTGHADIQ